MAIEDGQYIRDIAVVREGRLHFDDDHLLYVNDIVIMNVGLKNSREAILKYGIGLMIEPKSRESVITLSNVGQRQAILHDVSSVLGIFSDTGIPSLTPLAKRDLETGRIGVFLIPANSRSRPCAPSGGARSRLGERRPAAKGILVGECERWARQSKNQSWPS